MTDEPGSVHADVAELAKKSSVSWILAGAHTYPVWHEWVDDADGDGNGAICVVGSVTAGIEQPIPDVPDGTTVTVLLRSKTDRALAARVPAVVHIIGPESRAWEQVTQALKSGRLNAVDMADQVQRWARDCRVLRLVPTGAPSAAADREDDHPRTAPRLS